MDSAEEILRAAGILFPFVLLLPICVSCGTAIANSRSSFADHMRKPPHNLTSAQYQPLCECVEELSKRPVVCAELRSKYLEEGIPRSSSEPLPRIAGIEVCSIFKCPYCDHFTGCLKKLASHIRLSGHVQDCRISIHDLQHIEPQQGQALWKKKGRRVFFPIIEDGEQLEPPSGFVSRILQGLKAVTSGNYGVSRPSDKREMCAFVESTRGDIRLEQLNIKWDDAVMLCGGPLVRGCVLDREVRDRVKGALISFFSHAKASSHGEIMNGTEVMSAVAAPGAVEKNKLFSFKNEKTEEKYAGRCSRMLLMTLRVLWLMEQTDSRVGAVTMSGDLRVAVEELRAILTGSDQESAPNDHHLGTSNQSRNPWEERTTVPPAAGTEGNTSHETQHAEMNGKLNGMEVTKARRVHEVLRLILHEKSSLERGSAPSFASSFISCLLVTRSGTSSPRLCEGREISPTLASVAYAAGCVGILSISQWPQARNAEEELERIKELHAPGGRRGINLLQETAAKTKLTRNTESSRALWVECHERGHRNCGFLGGTHLSATDVGRVVVRMQEELYEALLGKSGILCGSTPPLGIMNRLDCLVDDELNREVGFCFADHPENKVLVSEMLRLVEAALRTFSPLDEDAAMKRCDELLEKIERSSFLLMSLLHLTGGSPGRGSEEGFQAVRNNGKGPREYFILGRRLASIPGYNKTRSMCGGKMRMISRHPDKLTGNLFKAFVILAMPMRGALLLSQRGDDTADPDTEVNEASFHILSERKARVCALEKMANCWKDHGLNLGGTEYRQWFGGYANDKATRVPSSCLIVQPVMEEDAEHFDGSNVNIGTVMQMQAGHSVRTARTHYGRSANGLSPDGSLDPRTLHEMMAASNEWLEDIGISTSCGRDNLFQKASIDPEKRALETEGKESCSDGKNGNASRKGFDDDEDADTCPGGSAELSNNGGGYQESTLDHHQKIEEKDGTFASSGYSFTDHFNEHEALRKAVGRRDVTFRSSVQQQAMGIVARGEGDLLLCDRTGGGKSAVIFGPSLFENGVTVYVCPLVSLQEDLKARCMSSGLPVTVLKEVLCRREPLPMRGILLTTPEYVGNEEYVQTVGQLWALGRLCRIVVDELHMILLSEHYRPCMTRMRQVRPDDVKAQLVAMTATAPQGMVGDMLGTVGVEKRDVRILRGSSRRDNIAIRVKKLARGDRVALIHDVVEETIQGIINSGPDTSKHVVAALTHADVEDVYAELISDQRFKAMKAVLRKYHSGMTRQERIDCCQEWRETQQTFVIIATDGFGVGMDAPNVRHVIFAGCSRSLVDFWQVVGRVGRDGRRGKATVLYHPAHRWRAAVDDPRGKRMLEDFANWAQSDSTCRVSAIETYFGGEKTTEECWARKSIRGGPVEICDVCAYELGKAFMIDTSSCGHEDDRRKEGEDSKLRAIQSAKRVSTEPSKQSVKRRRTNVMSTAEIRNEIAMLRVRARRIGKHCPACMLGNSRVSVSRTSLTNGGVHSKSCFVGKCLRCVQSGHDARDCRNITKPARDNGVRGCKACFLWTVRGMPIHEGFGPAHQGTNEFGSTERCPFKNTVSVAMGCWHDMKLRRKMMDTIEAGPLTMSSSPREFSNWLIRDNSSSGPGIIEVSRFLMSEFKY